MPERTRNVNSEMMTHRNNKMDVVIGSGESDEMGIVPGFKEQANAQFVNTQINMDKVKEKLEENLREK